MRLIEIVTHCYCPPNVPWYAEHLKWQFASLVLNKPERCKVKWTVFATLEDQVTCRRLDRCRELLDEDGKWLTLNFQQLQPAWLFRRSIGRDRASKVTKADIVWYTDADYLFGPGCLDAVADKLQPSSLLHMPKQYWISFEHDEKLAEKHKNPHHRRGQIMIEQELLNDLPKIDDRKFKQRISRIAIGGQQIIGGNFARKQGYLRGIGNWQSPVEDVSMGFKSCRCDNVWRRIHSLAAKRIDIPNLFRIRHTVDGRDYSKDGERLGKKAW